MSEKSCIHCGRTTRAEEVACSTGCDLARRLPRSEEALPASRQLGVLLGWGFVAFNQLLLALGALGMRAREEWETAQTFGILSLVTGALILFANLFLIWIARPKRWTDAAAFAASVVLGILLGRLADRWIGEALVIGFSGYNLLICIWLSRGLWRGNKSKKKQKTD